MKLESISDNIQGAVALGLATVSSIGWTLPQWLTAVSIGFFVIQSIDRVLSIWDRFAAKRKKPPELPP